MESLRLLDVIAAKTSGLGTIIFLVLKCQDLWIKNTFDYIDFLLSHYLKSIHTTKMFRDVK